MIQLRSLVLLCLLLGACHNDSQLPIPDLGQPVPTSATPSPTEDVLVRSFIATVAEPAPAVTRSGTGVALLAGTVLALRAPDSLAVQRMVLSLTGGGVQVLPGGTMLAVPCLLDRPAWLPGGDQLACNTGTGIFALRTSGPADPVRLTSSAADRDATLSVDGQHIAYARPSPKSGLSEIYLGPEDQPLTANGPNSEPCFSPDGERLAFSHGTADGAQEIHLLDLRTRVVARLTSAAVDSTPSFSPDGKQIAFARRTDGGSEVRLLPVDLAVESQHMADGDSPFFAADGRLGYRRPGVGYVIGDQVVPAAAVQAVRAGPTVPPHLLVGAGSLFPDGVQGLIVAGDPAPNPGVVVLIEGQPQLSLVYDGDPYAVVQALSINALTYQAFGAAPPPRTRLPASQRQALSGAYLVLRGAVLSAVVTQGGADTATVTAEGQSLVLRGSFNGVFDEAGLLVKAGPLQELRIDMQSGNF